MRQLTNISHPRKCVSLKLLTGKIFLKSKDIRTKDPLIKKKKTHVLLLVSWMLTLVQKEMI